MRRRTVSRRSRLRDEPGEMSSIDFFYSHVSFDERRQEYRKEKKTNKMKENKKLQKKKTPKKTDRGP